MSNIYTIAAPGTLLYPINRCVLGVFNGTGSGRVIRVYKVWALNNQTVAITGTILQFELRKLTTGSGGTPLVPLKHDSTSPGFPAQIIAAQNLSYTLGDLVRRIPWSSDEPVAFTANTTDELETVPSLNVWWESSYTDTNVQPLVLRPGEGLGIIQTTSTTVGVADFFIELTVETT